MDSIHWIQVEHLDSLTDHFSSSLSPDKDDSPHDRDAAALIKRSPRYSKAIEILAESWNALGL